MIIDGRAMSAEILARAKARASALVHSPKVVALVGSDTPATRSYLAIKEKRAADAGCVLELRPLDASTSDADAVIVQLPVPKDVVMQPVLDAISVGKDADVLSSAARAAFMRGDGQALLPPVVGAIAEILSRADISISQKSAVVVGSGYLVGAPAAAWLAQEGARVVSVNHASGDLKEALAHADIIVLGAGSPHLVQPSMIKEGAVLIDAGTSESGGVTVGDADPACAEKCAVFTPVPGGVGPIAVAKLFENAVILTERAIAK